MARTSSKIVKTIPNAEIEKATCFTKHNSSGDKYIITENPLKAQYTLWKCVEEGFEKIKPSDNPRDFDEETGEYEVLYDEYTQGAIPKLAIAHEVYASLSDDDLNKIIHAFVGLDYKNMTPSDILKVFLKISPRLALKFTKLFKILF